MLRKAAFVGFTLVVMCLLTSCDAQNAQQNKNVTVALEEEGARRVTKSGKSFCSFYVGGSVLAEEYAVLSQRAFGMTRYFDVATGVDVVFCFEPNCEHKKPHYDVASGTMLDDTCVAYHLGKGAFSVREDAGYYFDDSKLYRTSREGKNQKCIAEVSEPIEHTYSQIYTKDYFATTYQNAWSYKMVEEGGKKQWISSGEARDTEDVGVYVISLSDGSCTKIFHRDDRYSTFIDDLYEYDGCLYFDCHYMDVPLSSLPPIGEDYNRYIDEYMEESYKHTCYEFYRYDFATGELSLTMRVDHAVGQVAYGEGYVMLLEEPLSKGAEPTMVYRLDGTFLRQLDFTATMMASSDGNAVLSSIDGSKLLYYLYDVNNGKILKQVKTGTAMRLVAAIGNTYWLNVPGDEGLTLACMNGDDFWNGDFSKMVTIKENVDR